MIKRCWAEVSLPQIRKNYGIYKSQLPEGMEIMGVVKADSYGHGDIQVSKELQKLGCRNFAVSNITEAIGLREAGIEGQILILGYTPVECAKDLIKYDITQAVIEKSYADDLIKELGDEAKRLKVHFALDTGMNRIGLDADDTKMCSEVIHSFAAKLDITGIFTHLCVADDQPLSKGDVTKGMEFTRQQLDKFNAVAEAVADMKLPYMHCLNSAGGLWYNSNPSALARLGIILYGLKPDYTNTLPEGIAPALTWKSVIAMVKEIHPGETVGYGRSFKADKDMKVATVPVGYADGYNRHLSNKGFMIVNGRRCNILGRVCMDQTMIDVTDAGDVKRGDEVILMGKEFTADDMAQLCGNIGYEITCDISKRVERVYEY